jgi:hypothetical protein
MTAPRALRGPTRLAPRCAGGVALIAGALATPSVSGDPQLSATAMFGAAASDLRTGEHPHAALAMSARGDALFLRSREKDMAVGPYVEVGSVGFETLDLGVGAEWLIPALEAVPFIFSVGPELHRAPGAFWQPGAEATVFFGSHSFNYHEAYSLTAGVFLQGRYGFGGARQGDAVLGAQIDLALLALPFVYLYEAAR